MIFNRLIVLTGLLFALGVAGTFGVDAYLSRRETARAAEYELRKSTDVLAERVKQMFGAADRTLTAAQIAHQTWRRDPNANTGSGHRILRALAESSDVLRDIAWFEADGLRRVTSLSPFPAPINAGDREFFKAHTGSTDSGLYIGQPIRAVVDSRWITPVSRRMTDESGKFIGVVGGVLDVEYIEGVLVRFNATNGAAYSIILDSGSFLARVPYSANRVGESALGTSLFRDHLPLSETGIYRATSIATGEERLFGYRKATGLPLIVVASLGRAEIFAPWFERIRITGLLALAAIIGALSATFFIHRQALRLRIERREAEHARRMAEHANRSKSEFLAHVSHELRTPMNAVIGFTEMISREVFGPVGSPKYREYLGHIAVSGQHLLQVVNNVLDLAKVEAGKWEMDEEDVDLREMCESTGLMVRERARSAGVALTISTQPDLCVRADRRLLRQIVINLLTNGIKFTERGGTVSVSWSLRPDGAVALDVSDTGVGMTEEDCLRVMEPFGRGSAELARARHDTGLGLSICRQFAEMHGGRMELKSALGKGTTVSVVLPRERVRVPAAMAAAA